MLREYFEDGCLCIAEGKIKKLPEDDTNNLVGLFYLANCTCSRSNGLKEMLEEFGDE